MLKISPCQAQEGPLIKTPYTVRCTPYSLWLHRFAKLTALATFVLICAGALVTSTDSGLAVPDWPLSYGQFFPRMIGGILFEHGHRMIAAFVGLLALILALWLVLKEPRRWVRILGIVALCTIILQAVLGGMTVLFLLPDVLSIGHAALAQLFFCLMVSVALFTSPAWNREDESGYSEVRGDGSLKIFSLVISFVIYLQILFGAYFRHTGHGILIHVGGALAVVLTVTGLWLRMLKLYFDQKRLLTLSMLLLVLTVVQLTLGLGSYVARVLTSELDQPHVFKVAFTVAHLALGALMMGVSLLVTLWSFRLSRVRSLAEGVASSQDTCPDHRSGLRSAASLAPPTYVGDHGRSLRQRLFRSNPFTVAGRKKISAYLELAKPRITFLVLVTTFVGFCLGREGSLNLLALFHVLLGTALVASGTSVLNQYLEREADSRMKRTLARPLPSGRLQPERALILGVILSVAGILHLAVKVNHLTSFLGAMALSSYLFIYTPLKSRTSLSTIIGAIPGALPPVMGWTAARASIGFEAWILFSILFLWQLPHFLSLASLYREDYARAGFQTLPVLDPEGIMTGRQIVLYSLALLTVSLLPSLGGMAGFIYFLGALISGLVFLVLGIRCAVFAREVQGRLYRSLFHASVLYLPILLILMVIDKV